MASKSKRARMAPQRNFAKTFMYWATTVFVIKLIIIFSIAAGSIEILTKPYIVDGVWLGSDGENYITGFNALIRDGIFSKENILSYWPAGYPLIILLLSILGKSWALTTLSIVQSLTFSFAAYLFASQLARTRIKKSAYLVFILIILNPTLSLSSIAVGYESLTASGFLIAAGLIIKDFIEKDNKKFIKYLVINSVIFGLLTFMQPRLILSGILINLFWVLIRNGVKASSLLVIVTLAITLFFPASLIYRNYQAIGVNSISTNLGVTMNIGAGDKATGGYMKKDYGVLCETNGTAAQQDSQKVKCVLDWYLNNPSKAVKLFYNKTLYFFSPWIGPAANGTMARNPWLNISPIANIASTPDGNKLVYGGFGKLISWLWLLGGIALIIYGFLVLWRLGSLEKFIALMAMIAVSTNWLVSLISIGDHRFRLPIMGMSLFLQAVGLKTLFSRGKVQVVDGPALR
jgi:hypothetical protein